MQLTGSNPVPHDYQKGVQLHSGSSTFPVRVQTSGQCLETHILGALSCHSLQVCQEVCHSHSAWDRAWWGGLDWAMASKAGYGLWTVTVISGLVTGLPHGMPRNLGQVSPLSQVFLSISEWTKEDEPGQYSLLY